jgi:hypothetical protein
MLMRRNAKKNDNLRKLMEITIERKPFKVMLAPKTFRNWRQGRNPNFSNSSSKHSCMGERNDQELIMNLGLPSPQL